MMSESRLDWIAKMEGSVRERDGPGARTAIDYGLYGVPETFVIDRGEVAYKHTGHSSRTARLQDRLVLSASNLGKAAASPVVP